MNILITGATGYLGSQIANSLLKSGHKVYATCRKSSNFDKCVGFKDKLIWLNQEIDNWSLKIKDIDLDLLIHTAWAGVSALERDDWNVQLTNFQFSKAIFDFSISLKVKKIICLGSQAEYGKFDSNVDEKHMLSPIDAYGSVKTLTLNYLQNLAHKETLDWYWLRVFSIIGENENETWLLPQVMSKLLSGKQIELTEGRQCYDYLYIGDFIKRLNLVINHKSNNSGVFNICSGRSVEIRQLLLLIAQKLEVPASLLNFGAVPYRINQNMSMVGSTVQFEQTFGTVSMETLEDTVIRITEFYKRKSE